MKNATYGEDAAGGRFVLDIEGEATTLAVIGGPDADELNLTGERLLILENKNGETLGTIRVLKDGLLTMEDENGKTIFEMSLKWLEEDGN